MNWLVLFGLGVGAASSLVMLLVVLEMTGKSVGLRAKGIRAAAFLASLLAQLGALVAVKHFSIEYGRQLPALYALGMVSIVPVILILIRRDPNLSK